MNLSEGRGSLGEGQNKGGHAWMCSGDSQGFQSSGLEVVWWDFSCKLGRFQIVEGFKTLEKESNSFFKINCY